MTATISTISSAGICDPAIAVGAAEAGVRPEKGRIGRVTARCNAAERIARLSWRA